MTEPVQGTRKYSFWLKTGFVALVCLSMLLLAEIASQFILYKRYGASDWFGTQTPDGSTVYDPLLGWRGTPGASFPNQYGPDKHLTYNSAGLRGPREYGKFPADGRYRIICIGDSFTQGWGVGDEDSYPAWMERVEPRLEVVNMGMAGYGIDQAYLRYKRDGAGYRAGMLIFAVISDDFNRIGRDTFKMRRFKPWLELATNGSLEVRGVDVPNPAERGWSQLIPRSALYKFWRRFYFDYVLQPDVWTLATAVFADTQRIAGERGQRFVLVFFPTLAELRQVKEGYTLSLADQCAEWSRRSGVEFIDVTPAFDPVPQSELEAYFSPPRDPHYSDIGNRIVAKTLLQRIFPDGIPAGGVSTELPITSRK